MPVLFSVAAANRGPLKQWSAKRRYENDSRPLPATIGHDVTHSVVAASVCLMFLGWAGLHRPVTEPPVARQVWDRARPADHRRSGCRRTGGYRTLQAPENRNADAYCATNQSGLSWRAILYAIAPHQSANRETP
jgi:hypothetical protein